MAECKACNRPIDERLRACPLCGRLQSGPEALKIASPTERFCASVYETFMLAGVGLLIALMGFLNGAPGAMILRASIGIPVGVQVALWTQSLSFGKTFGMMRVVDLHGKNASFARMLLRETLGKVISAIPLGLGFLWVLWDPCRRGWHDHIAGTLVVKQPPVVVKFGPVAWLRAWLERRHSKEQ